MTAASSSARPIVLASTSPFRRELLQRLGLDFTVAAPNIDESAKPEEQPDQLVRRLAQLKAKAVATSHQHALIIGSDQVATINGKILGKPGDHQKAIEQLTLASGQKATFFTGLCLFNSATGNTQVCCELFDVYFRCLDPLDIENYLQREKPYNCAGSFKSEGLGITLFSKMAGDDPNTLIGLPLMRLVDMLRSEGVNPLDT
ncbi:MAG: nucleoside triphosphate pyrophosphatase [Gammaproteobacteria bacterium]|nr:nucleoside triphosphate pyrophosphatase [Gammaproteobacteria bacterium]